MNKEIEVRFLDVDKLALIQKLHNIGAKDRGEILLTEVIYYDTENAWVEQDRMVRLRKHGDRDITMTYKHRKDATLHGTYEAEFSVSNLDEAHLLLEGIGLVAFRRQEKLRHTFEKDGVLVDIDTWPRVPTYAEIEGPSEEAIRSLAAQLGFAWEHAVLKAPKKVLKEDYGIPITELRWFTFDRIE